MPDMFSRRNAMLGWAMWSLAKWRLRRAPRKEPRRRRGILRVAVALAVFGALAAVWAKRSRGTTAPPAEQPVEPPVGPSAEQGP